jgi:hypothetical protein
MIISSLKQYGQRPTPISFGQNDEKGHRESLNSDTPNDSFFLNFDPKSLFDKADIPSAIRIINLNETPHAQAAIEPRILKELRPNDSASPFGLSTSPEQVFNKTQADNQKQDAIRNGVKLALMGVGAIAGAYLLCHGLPIGGVLLTDPSQLLHYATLFTGVLYSISEAASRFLANPTVSNKIQDNFRSILKKVPSVTPSSSGENIRFQGSQQQNKLINPGALIIKTLIDTVEQYCSLLDNTENLQDKCALVMNMEIDLVKNLGQVLKQSENKSIKNDTAMVNSFLANHQTFYSQIPLNASTFKDIPAETKEKFQRAVFYALMTPCAELQEWGKVSARDAGIPAQSVQKVLESRGN